MLENQSLKLFEKLLQNTSSSLELKNRMIILSVSLISNLLCPITLFAEIQQELFYFDDYKSNEKQTTYNLVKLVVATLRYL